MTFEGLGTFFGVLVTGVVIRENLNILLVVLDFFLTRISSSLAVNLLLLVLIFNGGEMVVFGGGVDDVDLFNVGNDVVVVVVIGGGISLLLLNDDEDDESDLTISFFGNVIRALLVSPSEWPNNGPNKVNLTS